MAVDLEQLFDSIMKLPPEQRARLRARIDTAPSDHSAPSSNGALSGIDSSLEWIRSNRHSYPGKWIALDGDKLIASGSTAREVYDNARTQGVVSPFVEQIVDDESEPFTGGWLS